MTETGVIRLLFGLDLSRAARELAPAAITAAAHGNAMPLARLTHTLQSEAPSSRLTAQLTETVPLTFPQVGLATGAWVHARLSAL